MLSSLTPEEREHYDWLIRGLLAGGRRLVGVPGKERLLGEALERVELLLLEVSYREDASAIDFQARFLEDEMIEGYLASSRSPDESSADSQQPTASPH